MNSVLLNFGVRPSAETTERLIEMASSVDESAIFRIGLDHPPHLTLYMARFPIHLAELAADLLRQTLTSFSKFVAESHTRTKTTPGGYLEVPFRRSRQLIELQEGIASPFIPHRYRRGYPQRESYFDPYTISQRWSAVRTGYDLYGSLFRPHITLARSQDRASLRPFDLAQPIALQIDLISIHVADQNGACRELVDVASIGG